MNSKKQVRKIKVKSAKKEFKKLRIIPLKLKKEIRSSQSLEDIKICMLNLIKLINKGG